jgi:Transposase DDE domain
VRVAHPNLPALPALGDPLIDPQEVHKHELFTLYRQRWQVELDLRSIKVVMPMDSLRCKSPERVHKESAVHLLTYNRVRAVMAQAAYRGNILSRQLSFKGALQLLNAFAETLRHGPRGQLASCQAHLLASMARLKLPDRPGRAGPRAIKRRPKPYRLLTKPRHTWRARLVRQQEKRRVEFLR